jgi:hypothetical protein
LLFKGNQKLQFVTFLKIFLCLGLEPELSEVEPHVVMAPAPAPPK